MHAVRINDIWYPVRQAFGRATGLPGVEFTSHIARWHLAALGYQMQGQIEQHADEWASPVRMEARADDGDSGTSRRSLRGKVRRCDRVKAPAFPLVSLPRRQNPGPTSVGFGRPGPTPQQPVRCGSPAPVGAR